MRLEHECEPWTANRLWFSPETVPIERGTSVWRSRGIRFQCWTRNIDGDALESVLVDSNSCSGYTEFFGATFSDELALQSRPEVVSPRIAVLVAHFRKAKFRSAQSPSLTSQFIDELDFTSYPFSILYNHFALLRRAIHFFFFFFMSLTRISSSSYFWGIKKFQSSSK